MACHDPIPSQLAAIKLNTLSKQIQTFSRELLGLQMEQIFARPDLYISLEFLI